MAAHKDYPRTRLFVEQALGADESIALMDKPHHYLAHVLRMKPGDAVALFNGRDGEWRGRIESVGKKDIGLTLVERLRQQPASHAGLTLAFAPIKQHMELMVQKATELGVARLQPVVTQHTVVGKVNLARLRENAIEAAEQCERLEVPEIAEPIPFAAFLREGPTILYGDESGGSKPIGEVIASLPTDGSLVVFVGPEGGFAAHELAQLNERKHAFGCSLGPRILRVDTAALALLSVCQASRGDWNDRPRFRQTV